MSSAIIIVDDNIEAQKLGAAMSRAIEPNGVRAITAAELSQISDPAAIYCPLTLDIPPTLEFWGQLIGQTCLDVETLRRLATAQTGIKVSNGGNKWLPIIWTARGPMYGEVIGAASGENYHQPVHLSDLDRQPLYQFGYQLLSYLTAPPATYLIQFSHRDEVIFDRLFPFPATPALASISTQQPDLFTCHWRCITHQPMVDILV